MRLLLARVPCFGCLLFLITPLISAKNCIRSRLNRIKSNSYFVDIFFRRAKKKDDDHHLHLHRFTWFTWFDRNEESKATAWTISDNQSSISRCYQFYVQLKFRSVFSLSLSLTEIFTLPSSVCFIIVNNYLFLFDMYFFSISKIDRSKRYSIWWYFFLCFFFYLSRSIIIISVSLSCKTNQYINTV